MTRNEMRALAKQIISDAAAVVTAAYAGQEHRPDMTMASLLAHYVLLECPPEDSEPVFTLDEVADLLHENADSGLCKRVAVIHGQQVKAFEKHVFMKRVKAALRKLKGKE